MGLYENNYGEPSSSRCILIMSFFLYGRPPPNGSLPLNYIKSKSDEF